MKTKAIIILFLCMMIHISFSQEKEDIFYPSYSESENVSPDRKIVDQTQAFQKEPRLFAERFFIKDFFDHMPKNNANMRLVIEYGDEHQPSLEQIIEYIHKKLAPKIKSPLAQEKLTESLGFLTALKSVDHIFQIEDFFYGASFDDQNKNYTKTILRKDIRPEELFIQVAGYRIRKGSPKELQKTCYKVYQPNDEFYYGYGFFTFPNAHQDNFAVYKEDPNYIPEGGDGDVSSTIALTISKINSQSAILIYSGRYTRFNNGLMRSMKGSLILAFSLETKNSQERTKPVFDCIQKLNRFAPELF